MGGLGLSTVARDGGKTAEEMADMKTLVESQQQKNAERQPSDSSSNYGSDSSDAGLPPPLPPSNKLGLKLNVGGLGLSTVAKDGGKTAEELGDIAALRDSMAQ